MKKDSMKKRQARKSSARPEVEQQLEEYFSISPRERKDCEADLRLTELIGHLLDLSPGRQQLALDVYRACSKAWDAMREEHGLTGQHEREVLHHYHELLVELADGVSPLPPDESINRALEIFGAGADPQTRAAINRALKSGTPRERQNLWARVHTYGYIEGGAR